MSSETPDANKIAAEVIIAATERAVAAAADPARTTVRRLLQSLSDAYRPYLEQTFLRVRTIRTFLKPNEPVDLLTHYVPVYLKTDENRYSVEDIVDHATSIGGPERRRKSRLGMRELSLSWSG